MYYQLRRRLRRRIRRVADWRLRLGLRVGYGLMVVAVWTVVQLSNLICRSAISMFRR